MIETAEMPPLARSVALLAELEGVATGADLAMAGAVCDVIDAAMPATGKLRERGYRGRAGGVGAVRGRLSVTDERTDLEYATDMERLLLRAGVSEPMAAALAAGVVDVLDGATLEERRARTARLKAEIAGLGLDLSAARPASRRDL